MHRFGTYRLPRVRIGERVECEYAGTVLAVAISDAAAVAAGRYLGTPRAGSLR